MRFFIPTILLFVSSGLALPYPLLNQHALRSVPKRSLEKRDAVCGADFRSLVNSDSCAGKSPAFVLATPNAAVVTAQAQPPVPDNVQCDHVVELQLLNSVAQTSGLCGVLTALEAADSTKKKATMLDTAAQHISALQNLNFVQDTVNNQKKTVIQRALKGSAQGTTTLDAAVKDYLSKVKSDGEAVATTLDTDIGTIITAAKGVLATLPDGKGGSRSRDPKDVVKRNLQQALDTYAKSSTTVGSTFKTVLTSVGLTA